MSKVILSTGYEFTLADNGYGASDNSVNFTIVDNKSVWMGSFP